MFSTVAVHVRFALIILVIVLLVILLSKWTGSPSKITVINTKSAAKNQAETFVQQSRQYLEEAQRSAPTVAAVHAAHAEAYLNAAELVAPGDIKSLHIQPLRAQAQLYQQQHSQPTSALGFTTVAK